MEGHLRLLGLSAVDESEPRPRAQGHTVGGGPERRGEGPHGTALADPGQRDTGQRRCSGGGGAGRADLRSEALGAGAGAGARGAHTKRAATDRAAVHVTRICGEPGRRRIPYQDTHGTDNTLNIYFSHSEALSCFLVRPRPSRRSWREGMGSLRAQRIGARYCRVAVICILTYTICGLGGGPGCGAPASP